MKCVLKPIKKLGVDVPTISFLLASIVGIPLLSTITLPSSVVAKAGTLKKNNYVDPEGTNYGNDILSEIGEFGAAPTNRTFGGGIKVVL